MNKRGAGLIFLLVVANAMAKDIQLLNVPYDPAYKSYEQYDKASSVHWKQQTGNNVVIRQLHGGSNRQAVSVTNDTETDVATLILACDVDAIVERGRIDREWIRRLPDSSAPYTSTIVFLMRKGNPKQVHGWSDLIKLGVSVIMPSPKSSDGACWNYLTAWGYVLHHNSNDQTKAQDFVRALHKDVEVLDSGTRGPTNTFVERGIGDVLTAWEDEALLIAGEPEEDKFEIITPSESIFTEPVVSVADKVVGKKGTKEVAEAYLRYLYSPEGQEITAKSYYCPRDAEVAKKHENAFPKLGLFTIDEELGGWTKAQEEHSANGGTFDQINRR